MNIDININIPNSWNELTDWQMKAIGSVYHTKGEVFDLAIWFVLNNVKRFDFVKKKKLQTVMRLVPLSELKKHFSFIYDENNRDVFVDLIGYQKPQPRIYDFTIERFSYADDLNNKFLETGDFNYLKHLLAVLYLKKDETFEWDLQNKRARRFKRIPNSTLIAVHLCWCGVKNHIVNRFPKVYPKVKSVQGKSTNQKGFLDVVLQMSGQKFGTYEETKKTRVLTFLSEFNNSIILHEKIKENGKKSRSR